MQSPTAMDLSKVDLSKVDVTRAVADAAIAVGLADRPRSRWPLALGAVLAASMAGIAIMNADRIGEAIREARRWIAGRVEAMTTRLMPHDPVAFTAADTMPIEPPAYGTEVTSWPDAYPEGLGSSPESVTANGRSKVTSPI